MSAPGPSSDGSSAGPASADQAGTGRDEPGEASVLGSLPRRRPGMRSPRRAQASGPAEPPRDAAAGDAAAPGERDAPDREQQADGLARAGISLAGEAATLGLRIAGRTAAALRDAVERR